MMEYHLEPYQQVSGHDCMFLEPLKLSDMPSKLYQGNTAKIPEYGALITILFFALVSQPRSAPCLCRQESRYLILADGGEKKKKKDKSNCIYD